MAHFQGDWFAEDFDMIDFSTDFPLLHGALSFGSLSKIIPSSFASDRFSILIPGSIQTFEAPLYRSPTSTITFPCKVTDIPNHVLRDMIDEGIVLASNQILLHRPLVLLNFLKLGQVKYYCLLGTFLITSGYLIFTSTKK